MGIVEAFAVRKQTAQMEEVSVQDIFTQMGGTFDPGVNTMDQLKIYPLHEAFGETAEDVEARVQQWMDSIGWEYKIFGPDSEGQGFTPPDFAKHNYDTNDVWLYQPRDPSGSFRDYSYTLPWRVTHEIAHAWTNQDMTEKYGGQGRRQGAMGVWTTHPSGKGEVAPLSLADALRAVEWEVETFKRQREILENEFGIQISDEEFNKENLINLSDAVQRALTGEFSDPADLGYIPSDVDPDEAWERAQQILIDRAKELGLSLDIDYRGQEERAISASFEPSHSWHAWRI